MSSSNATGSTSAGGEAGAAGPSSGGTEDPAVHEAVHEMFRNMAECLDGEMEVSSMDYQLLEKMNLRAAEKYHSMADHADSLVIARDKMVTKYEDFAPYVAQIDELDSNVADLEEVVHKLDEYTKRLEERFKAV